MEDTALVMMLWSLLTGVSILIYSRWTWSEMKQVGYSLQFRISDMLIVGFSLGPAVVFFSWLRGNSEGEVPSFLGGPYGLWTHCIFLFAQVAAGVHAVLDYNKSARDQPPELIMRLISVLAYAFSSFVIVGVMGWFCSFLGAFGRG